MAISIDKIPSLTPAQFKWAVKELNIRQDEYLRLYKILVEGRPVAELAEEAGITRQAVYLQTRRALGELERRLEQSGKEIVMLIVEPSAVSEVRAIESL